MVALAGDHTMWHSHIDSRERVFCHLIAGRRPVSGDALAWSELKRSPPHAPVGADGARRGALRWRMLAHTPSASSRLSETSGAARTEPCGCALSHQRCSHAPGCAQAHPAEMRIVLPTLLPDGRQRCADAGAPFRTPRIALDSAHRFELHVSKRDRTVLQRAYRFGLRASK